MSKSFWKSLPVQLLKLAASFAVSLMLVLIVFCIIFPADEATGTIDDKYNIYIVVISIVLAFSVNIIMEYNQVQKLKYSIAKTEADINSAREMRDSLIDKAERVTDKYRQDEKMVYEEFASARKVSVSGRIRNGHEFRGVVESYPEMKSNEHIQRLLAQLESSEVTLLNSKRIYSESVAKFNTKIHTFPIVIFRKICKWNDIEMSVFDKEEIVSDSDLGI